MCIVKQIPDRDVVAYSSYCRDHLLYICILCIQYNKHPKGKMYKMEKMPFVQ